MFGLLLAGLGSALGELSDSIGKHEVRARAATIYSVGFLNLLFGSIFIISTGLARNDLAFDIASLPTFLPRLLLEVLQAHISILAVVRADRGDFSIIRMLTIPLLLLVDVTLGYRISLSQISGIALIIIAVLLLSSAERFRTKAFALILTSAINAVVTISLYKYDISHFNSIAAEQSIICLAVMGYFFIMASRGGENPLSLLVRPVFFAQAAASGLAITTGSFAFLFAPAVVITTAQRAFSVLFATLSGRFYFRERQLMLKLALFCVIVVSLILLALQR